MLTELQRERYARHIALSEVGEAGVSALLESSVLIVGAGGLGSPAALYLAAAGVGHIGVVDNDVVSLSNLQRQVAHRQDAQGRLKAQSAADAMKGINSDLMVDVHVTRLDAQNAPDLIRSYDLVLDCTDGLDSKLLVNDTCVLLQKPFVHASVLGWYGQVMTYVPGRGPCYRCLIGSRPEPSHIPTCKSMGIAGPLVGVMGCLQALEAVKCLTGAGDLLTGRLLVFDGASLDFDQLAVDVDPICPACGCASG